MSKIPSYLLALVVIGILLVLLTGILLGLKKSQAPLPGKAIGDYTLLYTDSSLIYSGSWEKEAEPDNYYAPQKNENWRIPGSTVSFTFTGSKVTYNSFATSQSGIAEIEIDGEKYDFDQFDENASAQNKKPISWTSPDLSCGQHRFAATVSGRESDYKKSLWWYPEYGPEIRMTVVSFYITGCIPTSASPSPTISPGSTATSTPTRSATPTSLPSANKCQGNLSSSPRCFDCVKDQGDKSQINILDFACFSKYYGQKVGVGTNNQTHLTCVTLGLAGARPACTRLPGEGPDTCTPEGSSCE